MLRAGLSVFLTLACASAWADKYGIDDAMASDGYASGSGAGLMFIVCCGGGAVLGYLYAAYKRRQGHEFASDGGIILGGLAGFFLGPPAWMIIGNLLQTVTAPIGAPIATAQAQPATTTIETVAARIAREHNQAAPSMLGDTLLATTAVAVGRNVRLTYVVRTRRGLTQQQRSEFVAATKADVMPRACQVNAGNPAFERGLYYTFIYDNGHGERLTSFDVDRQLCAGR